MSSHAGLRLLRKGHFRFQIQGLCDEFSAYIPQCSHCTIFGRQLGSQCGERDANSLPCIAGFPLLPLNCQSENVPSATDTVVCYAIMSCLGEKTHLLTFDKKDEIHEELMCSLRNKGVETRIPTM